MEIKFNKILRIALIALFFSAFSMQLSAQSLVERRANQLFNQFAYAQAVPLYERVIKKEPKNKAVPNKLAESYRKLNRPADAVKWYGKVMENETATVEDYLYYAEALYYVGNREHAKKWFEKYKTAKGSDTRPDHFLKNIENQEALYKNSDAFRVTKTTLNTSASDFGATYTSDGLLFASSGYTKKYEKSVYPWDGKSFLDIFEVKFAGNDSSFSTPNRLNRKINSKYHDGPAAISPDGQWMAFTRNNFKSGKTKRSIDRVNKLKLFICRKEGSGWSKPKEYLYNSNQYSIGHPNFSADSKTLYFASDMPGGFGSSDIYRCRLENGLWGKAENLGASINTEGNEFTPFMVKDSVLFFASSGRGGIGGLDIFSSEMGSSGFKQAENLGFPVNTQFDDFALIYNADKKSGFFSSNRDGGKGSDDIYRFTYRPNPLSLLVLDKRSRKPLANVKVKITDNANENFLQTTDADGKIKLPLKSGKGYQVFTSLENYPDHNETVTVPAEVKPDEPMVILMAQPVVVIDIIDKYKNQAVNDASFTLFEVKNNNLKIEEVKLIGRNEQRFTLKPCTEYKVVAQKQGLPDAEQTFTSACTEAAEQKVRLLTGNPPPKGVPITLKVVDEQNNQPIAAAKVNMYNKANQELIPMLTDDNGVYETVLPESANVSFGAYRVGYFSTSKSKIDVKTNRGDKPITKELKLLKLAEGGIIALEGIFYDLAKFNIRPDAAKVLDYVVQVMEENPGMIIELGSHTDSRGSDADNLKLSDQRAKAAADYIISKGISAGRITGKGYGETQLKNRCGNGVKCDEKLHQENRRTEIKILDF